ncbi:MAG: SHOCT domain-containing protein [Planctomycetia bacterium]|nr:SHOCT domain-containing protein [Planctomycetia bacterium]
MLGGVWQTKPDQEMNTLRNLPAITPDQLSEFRTMLEAGELTPQEFEIVKRKLGRKISSKDPAPSENPPETSPSIPDSSQKEASYDGFPKVFPPNDDDVAKS